MTEPVEIAQDKRRQTLIERIGTFADLLSEHPLPGESGDVAYDLLRQAAAQLSSDALTIAHRGGDVVAWMYERHDRGRELFLRRALNLAEFGWTETPLYAAPPTDEVGKLREALEDVRDTLAHMATPARVDPDKHFSSQVKAFGDAFGYGALMTTASALWRQSLGDLQGGEFAVGPCVTTAANQLKRLDAALPKTSVSGRGASSRLGC